MTADGVVHPAILGPRLTGHGATSRIDDTDAGLLDGDQRFDRAVGPMQFIPSTWTVVGVDADGDGRRDPQDIDDASLATAVYLCSGTDDLATRRGPAGRRAPLQPQRGVRRPRARHHGRLPPRRPGAVPA